MNRYERYRAEIAPKQKVIRIIKETFDSKNPKFKKKNKVMEVVKTITIDTEIPIEEYESVTNHFDSSAFQSDDRFFSTTTKGTRYSISVCKELCQKALEGYNQEPTIIFNYY